MSVRLCCVSVIGLCYILCILITASCPGGKFFPGHGVECGPRTISPQKNLISGSNFIHRAIQIRISFRITADTPLRSRWQVHEHRVWCSSAVQSSPWPPSSVCLCAPPASSVVLSPPPPAPACSSLPPAGVVSAPPSVPALSAPDWNDITTSIIWLISSLFFRHHVS